jgi:hypothetical protein
LHCFAYWSPSLTAIYVLQNLTERLHRVSLGTGFSYLYMGL